MKFLGAGKSEDRADKDCGLHYKTRNKDKISNKKHS
jgi:hypothetical protein